jgi:hypothetical protein
MAEAIVSHPPQAATVIPFGTQPSLIAGRRRRTVCAHPAHRPEPYLLEQKIADLAELRWLLVRAHWVERDLQAEILAEQEARGICGNCGGQREPFLEFEIEDPEGRGNTPWCRACFIGQEG